MGKVSGEWRKQELIEIDRQCEWGGREWLREWTEQAGQGAVRSFRDFGVTNIALTVFMLPFNEHCELMDQFDQRQTCVT